MSFHCVVCMLLMSKPRVVCLWFMSMSLCCMFEIYVYVTVYYVSVTCCMPLYFLIGRCFTIN